MKLIIKKLILPLFVLFGIASCEGPLEEEVFSQLAPSTLLTSESGVNAVLNAAYTYAHRSGAVESWSPFFLSGMTAGETWGAGGSIESLWRSLIDFTWDSNHSQILAMWGVYFNAVRDANIVLDNLDRDRFSEQFITTTTAEVNFIRGWAYSELYNLFGPVPLYTSPADDPLQPRASDAEVRSFIEGELTAAIPNLPLDAASGKATKGAAMGVLCKYYMNTQQWQKAAELAKQIMDLGKYQLLPKYKDVFSITNEGNKEMVWVLPKNAASPTAMQNVNALVFPPDYPRPYTNNGVFAARTYLFDAFVNSFEATDTRKELIITQYTSTASGQVVPGLGTNRSFPYKYEFDPSAVGANAGNDLPVVRYADVLLCRAEALNEVSGPSQEVVDLINQVRGRAGAGLLDAAGLTKESLRDLILEDRGKEFFFEAKRREDLLRQGRFISDAQARGKSAQAYHRLFPIPQVDLDANAALAQNEGY